MVNKIELRLILRQLFAEFRSEGTEKAIDDFLSGGLLVSFDPHKKRLTLKLGEKV